MALSLRSSLIVFLMALISLLTSCTTFKPFVKQQAPTTVTGTFRAFYDKKSFEGFFSVSEKGMRLDIVNTLGFSVYGIYATPENITLKDYTSGKTYTSLKINNQDLSKYKPLIIYMMKNFQKLCSNHKRRKDVLVLACKRVENLLLPSAIVLKTENEKPLRLNLYNMKVIRRKP